MTLALAPERSPNFGLAWLLLCLVFAVHVTDEAVTGFLEVYNPTVMALRHRYWFPLPTFAFREWLLGLLVVDAILLLLTGSAYRNSRALRPLAYLLASVMLLNGLGHVVGTILGRTVESVQFSRPAPGFYTSPLLLAASLYLFFRLRATR